MSQSSRVCILTLTAVLAAGFAHAATVHLVDGDLVAAVRAVPPGRALAVEGLSLGIEAGPAALELTRYEIWAPDAQIEIAGPSGSTFQAPPRSVRMLGRVAGRPGSQVLVTVRESGEVRGLIVDGSRGWMLAPGADGGLLAHSVDLATKASERAFTCGNDELQTVDTLLSAEELRAQGATATPQPLLGLQPIYRIDVAIETDQEYLSQFGGNTTDATDYAADLLAYATLVYDAEVGTRFAIPYMRVWTVVDLWTQTSPFCALLEFGRSWNNTPPTGVSRTIVHMMSGKPNGGGVAWVGALCRAPFNYDHDGDCPALAPENSNYGGRYGYSGDLDGNFNPGSPQTIWDTVVVAHEIGHNFNSPHSHCYANLGGNPNHIDVCVNECTNPACHCGGAGSTSLPAGCPGGGQGCGTLMSYCHFQGGGYGNMGQTFGLGHPYGIAPERQAARMRSHVEANAGCLSLAALFTDGFENGNTTAWSDTVP